MSTNTFIRASLLATMGVAAMSITASAQSHARYGNVYDYESSKDCAHPCTIQKAPMAQTSARYGAPIAVQPAPAPVAPVYIPAPAPMAPAPAPTHVYAQATQTAPAQCPAGTTAQPNGTCMQTSSGYGYTGSTTSYGSGSTYSSGTTHTMSSEPVSCPAGTTAQADGTCLQGSGYSMGSTTTSSTTSYGSGSTYSSSTMSSEPVSCPAGTTAQADGTCLQGGSSVYTGSTVEIYTGDATTTSSTTSYGYTSDGAYGPKDYLPVRK